MIGSLLEDLSSQEEEKRGESFLLGWHGHFCYGHSPPIYRLWECELFTKTLIIISINIYSIANEPITFPCISFMFIEMKYTYCHFCEIFVMNFMSIFND